MPTDDHRLGAPKMRITREMTAAGIDVLRRKLWAETVPAAELDGETLAEVFRAMSSARRSVRRPSHHKRGAKSAG